MIKKKSLIILGIVAVLLIGALVCVNVMLKSDDEEKSDLKSPTTSSVSIFKTDEDGVAEIHAEVSGENFSFVREDDKWALNGFPDVKIKQSAVKSLLSTLANLNGEKKIADQADDLAAYGFEDPQARYTLMLSDGTQKVFLLGNQDPVSSSYYFKMSDEPEIYMLYSSTGTGLLRALDYYRDSSLLMVDTNNLSNITIRYGNGNIALETRVSGEGENASEVWWMTSPKQKKLDSQRLSAEILEKLQKWTIQEFVYDGTDKDSQYGLNPPAGRITLKDKTGNEQTVVLGSKTSDSRYIRIEGISSIYAIDAEADFAAVEPFLLIEKFINLENIDNVTSVEIRTSQGDNHTLAITRSGEEDASYQLDGESIDEKPFKKIYQGVIGLTADGFAQNPKRGAALYTVTYNLTNGQTKTHEYCEYDERNYAAFDSSGNCEYFIRRKKLEDMMTVIANKGSE